MNTTETPTLDIETILPWGKTKRVDTRSGQRDLSTAEPDQNFWALWRNPVTKQHLVLGGVSVGRDWKDEKKWVVNLWRLPPKHELERLETSIRQSVAVDADIEIPHPEGLDYWGYQKAGIRYALARPSTLIADAPRLGKTVQAIGFINAKPDIQKVLVVCPAGVKIEWWRHFQSWLTRPFNVRMVEPKWWPQADIHIINYDILTRYPEQLGQPFDLAICDEIHEVRNNKTKRCQAVLGIKATYKLGLTGTPMVNRPSEIFWPLHWLDPVQFHNFWSFTRKYTGGERGAFGYKADGVSTEVAERALQIKLRSTCMVRRTKEEVWPDLPPTIRTVIEIPHHDERLQALEREATRKIPAEKQEALKAALELAKVSDNPADYTIAVEALKEGASAAFELMSALRAATATAMIPYAIEHLNRCFEEGIQKIVFFSHHREFNDAIHAEFKNSVQHYGGMSPADKQAAIDRFHDDPSCNLFSGSLRASSVGIPLHCANHVVMGEQDWTPGIMHQAEERCAHKTQKNKVSVDMLVLEGSLIATMAKCNVEKYNAIDKCLDKDRHLLADEPIILPTYKPKAPKPISASRAEMIERSATMSPSTIAAVHECLKRLAGVCDGALASSEVADNKTTMQ